MSLGREREELRRILVERSVSFGDYTLSSGAGSGVYIDARKATLHPAGARLAAAIFLDELSKDPSANAVGGPTLGADPIVGAMLALCGNGDLCGFLVRKEEKKHGARKLIEGNLRKGDRAVMVEDVVTTGGSVLRAVEAVRAAGAEVSKVMAIVSRADAESEKAFKDAGVEFFSIFDVAELAG